MNTGYEDFEIAIDPAIDLFYPVRIRTASGQEFRDRLTLPLSNDRYTVMQSKIEYHLPASEDEITDFGNLLYETLLQGKIWGAFQTARDQAARNGNLLRIRLSIDPDQVEVALCPWEFTADDAGLPLATEHSFCRHVPRTAPIPALKVAPNETLKLVITSALPKELIAQHPLDVAAEIAGIQQSLKPLVDGGQLAIVEIPHLTGPKLQRMLHDERPHIVHYVGHGTVSGDSGFLVLEHDDGSRQDISARQLGILFRGSSVRLVVLNACKTSTVVTKLLRGIAPALMNANIPAVVGMQSSVLDQAGRVFAEEFYRALADGTPIDGCVAHGRKAIIARSLSNLDWGLATLYMRASNGMLFDGLERGASGDTRALDTRPTHSDSRLPVPATEGNSAHVSFGAETMISGSTISITNNVGDAIHQVAQDRKHLSKQEHQELAFLHEMRTRLRTKLQKLQLRMADYLDEQIPVADRHALEQTQIQLDEINLKIAQLTD